MKKILFLSALALSVILLVPACAGSEENGSEEKVPFGISPDSAKNEPAYGHEIVFEVQASGEVQAVIADTPWASVEVGAADAEGKTAVTVSLDANDGSMSRKCTLSVTAGKNKADVPIVQQTLSSLIGYGSEVAISGNKDAIVTFKLSKGWSLTLSDTRGSAPSWLDAEPKSGVGGERADIHFHPDFYNIGAESREAYARIEIDGGGFFFFHISQAPALPSQDFLDKTAYGYYNYDGAGAAVEFDALAHQTSVIRSGGTTSFRLIWPAKEKFMDFIGLPGHMAEKDEFTLKMFHSWITSSGKEEEYTVGVVKVTSDLVYAIDNDKHGFIFKNVQ